MCIVEKIILSIKNKNTKDIDTFYKTKYLENLNKLEQKINSINNNNLYDDKYFMDSCLTVYIYDDISYDFISENKLQEFYINIINYYQNNSINFENFTEENFNNKMEYIKNKHEYIDVTKFALPLNVSFYEYVLRFF